MTTSFGASFFGASLRRALLGASICLAGIAGATDRAWAQEAPAVQLGQAAQRTFNIPPQPLEPALLLFGQQSGRQVAANGDILAGLSSPGVQGTMSVEEALRRLLAGTGLTYTGIAGGTISLHRPGQGAGSLPPGVQQLDPVRVQGYPVPPQAMIDNLPPPYAGGQVATGGQLGLLGNRDVMDTPFNQTSYTAKKAQDQQAKSVRDVLIDDPSVRSTWNSGGTGLDFMKIRGFDASSEDVSYGGVYGVLPTATIAAELPDRVEVLKGPSAMLNGMPAANSIGGTINLVPKRATDDPLAQFTANYVSSGQFGGHADVGRRFGAEKQFGARFNAVYRAGETAVSRNTEQLGLGVLNLDFRGERVRLAADMGFQAQYIGGLMSLVNLAPTVPSVVWAPIASRNFSQPWGYRDTKELFGIVRGEVDVTENITAYASFGALDSRQLALGSGFATVTNEAGQLSQTPYLQSNWNTYWTAQAGLRALFDTGPIGHELAANGTTLTRTSGNALAFGTAYTSNLYNPTSIARPDLVVPTASKAGSSVLSSLALADTLTAADKRIQLTVGARLQEVQVTDYDASGAATSYYSQTALSPSVALVFKPWQNVSVYGNWIQGLQQGIIVPAPFTNAGEIFPPYKSNQFEVGVKVDWGGFTTTVSAFQINQPSFIADVATNALTLAGQQRNQGLEFNVFGEPTPGVRLLGGVMLIDAVLTNTEGGLANGWIAPGVPRTQANLYGEWDTPWLRGLTLNGRVVYTGSQYIDANWPRRSLASWTRLDLGARMALDNVISPMGQRVFVRFNVDNVLDTSYWAATSANQLVMGAPRTFRLSLTADF